MSDTKVCTECGIPKLKTEFYKSATCRDGLRGKCKSCSYEQQKEYNKRNPNYRTEYYHANKDKYRKASKRYAAKPQSKEIRNRINREHYHRNKEAMQARQNAINKKRKENKERIRDYLMEKYGNTPCLDCGGVFPWCAMDFDHRPGEKKEMKIGQQGQRPIQPEIVAAVEREIAKCDRVCANCHRIRTHITRKK